MKKLIQIICALGVCSVAAYGVPVVVGPGNPGNEGTDNVLFNDDTLPHSGTLVQGNFAGDGAGFVVNFTSDSGNGLLVGGGGQAEIIGDDGNDPLTQLTFGLDNSATFTTAIFNVDATADGFMTVAVFYLGPDGSPYEELVPLGISGENFYNVFAGEGARITSISLSTEDSGFASVRQIRLGGFAVGVPDGGATATLLGLGILGLIALRGKK